MKGQPTGLPSRYGTDQPEPLYGTCDGRFALTTLTESFASSLLPPDLELAPQSYTGEDTHPVLLMINDTRLNTNPFLEGISKRHHLNLKLHYNEFIVMLPYVQFKEEKYNTDGPFCFLPVLYLDSLLAVLGGRIFWEFNKDLAHFKVNNLDYEIDHEITRASYLNATFSEAPSLVLGEDLANFRAITPILQLPVIEYGLLGYISSVYKVGYENSYIGPFSMELTNKSCPYLPKETFQIPSIIDNPLGAFTLTYDWSLTYAKPIKL